MGFMPPKPQLKKDRTMDVLDELSEVASQPTSGRGRAVASAVDDLPARKSPIQKINYSHDGMIDCIIANRGISQNELAAKFGYSPSWISTVMQSDAFRDRLLARTAELVDPTLVATIEDQLKGVLARSMEILKEKLDAPTASIPDNLVLRSVELSSRALGLGVKAPQITINNNTMEAHLDNLGSRLEGLLARKKSEVVSIETPLLEQQR
jgi:transcriptional regulator with XRE-family HTH domain